MSIPTTEEIEILHSLNALILKYSKLPNLVAESSRDNRLFYDGIRSLQMIIFARAAEQALIKKNCEFRV